MLMLHNDSAHVTEPALDALPLPLPRGPIHQPVPHSELVRGIKAVAIGRGYAVTHQQLGLARSGRRLFGVMDLQPIGAPVDEPADHGFAIGFRNSTDETLGIRIVAGARVTVCDNLCMNGDMIALNRRNTNRLDLPAALAEGFERFLQQTTVLDRTIVMLKNRTLGTLDAKARIADLFESKVLPLRLFHTVMRNYFAPDESMTDCQPYTQWGLLNSCTRAIKILPPERRFNVQIALGKVFGFRSLKS